ncbi:Pentatricopeptide repeat-containing protein, chloroplastic, partial [Mucuna pruriens]
MAIRNLCNIPRFFSIPHSSRSTFFFSHILSAIPLSTPHHLSSSLLFSIGCSTLCSPKHPFASSSTFHSDIHNGHLHFNLGLHSHTRMYFCTYTCTPYWARPLATSEQVSQIIALIREGVDDLGCELNSMNVSLSDASVVDIFQILESERVSALQFFDWLKDSDPELCCDPDVGSLFVNNCGLLGNYGAMVPILSEFSLKRVFLGMKAFGFLLDLGLDKVSSMECVRRVMTVFNEVGGVYQSCGVQLLIEMFGLSGSFEVAEFVVRTAGGKVKHYNVLLRIMCKRGDCERVVDLVKEMKRSGCDMNVSTYNLLLSCLCKKGKIDEAWHVLEAMEKNYGLTDAHSFDILINFLCKCHRFDSVLKLLDKMTLKGIEPSILTHAAVIKSYFESGKYEEAHGYVIDYAGKLSCSSNANYSLLATLHLKNGNVLLACKVLIASTEKNSDLAGLKLDKFFLPTWLRLVVRFCGGLIWLY